MAVLTLRCGVNSINTICLHHEHVFLKKYPEKQTRCCDPFNKHQNKSKKRKSSGGLREISLDLFTRLQQLGVNTIPGQKLCPNCRTLCNEKLTATKECNEKLETDDEFNDESMEKDELNKSLKEMNLSPLKLHSLPQHSRVTEGTRKMGQVRKTLDKTQEQMGCLLSKALSIPSDSISTSIKNVDSCVELHAKAKDLDLLMELVKNKISLAKRKEIIQLLTLVPLSWSAENITFTFPNVTNYMVRQSRQILKEKGILAIPGNKIGKQMSSETLAKVHEFYCDNDYSRIMPGKKDKVSITRNVYEQKRLILCNLNELYTLFCSKHPDHPIRFSKFCSLRPKWCILVGSSGSHSVCVCTIHQNTNLLMNAIKLDVDVHELVEMMVCDRDSRQCMMHRCPNCPGVVPLQEYLETQLYEDTDQTTITFKQWTTTDRADLITRTELIEDFIEILVTHLNKLTVHSYVARSQANYLRTLKETLSANEVIVLGDFAENYTFVVQDEIQGMHWNNQQCTLHPVVIYYLQDGKLSNHSICIISDDRTHDVDMVYAVMKETINFIKLFVNENLESVHYFSDGCAGQYKNCKNFLNLCYHSEDFGVKCTWSFFATSHGKSPCDGIGGTMKRLAAKASLQRPLESQILNLVDFFNFCDNEIPGITSIYVKKSDVDTLRSNMKQRYEIAKTIPGTRGYHYFQPLSKTNIGTKRLSEEEKFNIKFDFVGPSPTFVFVTISQFVACLYDNLVWIGVVTETDDKNEDVKIKFLHPNFPSSSFHWPHRDDICWVPKTHILCIVNPPTTPTGRQYNITKEDENNISKLQLTSS